MIVKNIHLKNWRRISSFSACFLFAIAVSVSCKKDPTKFGTDTLSPESLLASGGVDTFALSTYSVEEDSFPTDNQLFTLAGSMHDPKMGLVNAGFCSQFAFTGSVTHPNTSMPVMDSVVLSLKFGGYYGKPEECTFQVYEINQDMYLDSTYYKNSDMGYYLTDLVDPSSAYQKPNVEDSVLMTDGTKAPPQLKLKLDNAWGYNKVYEAIHGTSFQTDEAFKNYFKGLKVKVQETNPAPGHGAIYYFDLSSAYSKITYFYKIVGDTTPYSFDMIVNKDCADFNQVSVDNSGYPVTDVLSNPAYGQSQFYTQAFKTRAKVDFPTVSNLPKNCVIHQALLVLPIAYQTGNLFYPSASLDIVIETDDYVTASQTYYDITLKRYVVDVKSYVQNIVSGNSQNKGVFLNSSYFSSAAERVVFNGPSTSYKAKPSLIIKYTQF